MWFEFFFTTVKKARILIVYLIFWCYGKKKSYKGDFIPVHRGPYSRALRLLLLQVLTPSCSPSLLLCLVLSAYCFPSLASLAGVSSLCHLCVNPQMQSSSPALCILAVNTFPHIFFLISSSDWDPVSDHYLMIICQSTNRLWCGKQWTTGVQIVCLALLLTIHISILNVNK